MSGAAATYRAQAAALGARAVAAVEAGQHVGATIYAREAVRCANRAVTAADLAALAEDWLARHDCGLGAQLGREAVEFAQSFGRDIARRGVAELDADEDAARDRIAEIEPRDGASPISPCWQR